MSAILQSDQPAQPQARPPLAGRRIWLFRLAALLLGLAPFVVFEGLCALFGWGGADLHDDPFVGFRSTRPLFVRSHDGTRYEIPQSRRWYFSDESFPAEKPANGFRIFVLGGSTVQGEPFEVETSFTTWLELSLQAADPSRQWDVVNCGGVSYATYRLVPILEEVLAYEPDLIIFYEGHNEFLEQRQFAHVQERGPLLNASLAAATHLRSYNLLRDGYLRLNGSRGSDTDRRTVLPGEVQALLDFKGGLEEYHRDDAWRAGVIAHFRFNLERIVQLAREAQVPLILMNPVSNLADSPPFKSEHRADLSTEELAEWESLCEAARGQLHATNRDVRAAAKLFKQACQLDPQHAGGFYNLAKCYEAGGRLEDARGAYLQAKELDVCPLRILAPMNDAVLAVARESKTPLVDANQLFIDRSQRGIVGADWLVDHVHPSIEGHQLLAGALLKQMILLDLVHPLDNWKDDQQARYRAHLDGLDKRYFARGMYRLEHLRGWARGRAEKLRAE